MKARIEKKLSKRLVQIAPSIFGVAWIDKGEPSTLAYEQGICVSCVWSVGGGADYWGEGCEVYTAWESWVTMWPWHGDFEPYPAGHRLEGYPDVSGYRPTTRNLLKLAALSEARERDSWEMP